MMAMIEALAAQIESGPVWFAGGVVVVVAALGRRTSRPGKRMSD